MPPITCPADIESLIQSKKIVIKGLKLERTNVLGLDSFQQACGEQGQFSIMIPADQDHIENGVNYWPLLWLQTLEKIDKIFSCATLKRIDDNTKTVLGSIRLSNTELNNIFVPFSLKPYDASNNFYQRKWKWPEINSWGRVADV